MDNIEANKEEGQVSSNEQFWRHLGSSYINPMMKGPFKFRVVTMVTPTPRNEDVAGAIIIIMKRIPRDRGSLSEQQEFHNWMTNSYVPEANIISRGEEQPDIAYSYEPITGYLYIMVPWLC